MRLIGLAFAIVSTLYVTSANARELKILNLNMWGVELQLPEFVVKSPSVELEARTARLPQAIASLNPDVVVFEEVWSDARAEKIEALVKPLGYMFSARAQAAKGWILGGGNGLLVVSKLRLDSNTQSMAYSATTRWDESKLVCRKGAMKTRIEVEPNKWVDLYATHLGATGIVLKGGKAVEFAPREVAAQAEQIRELMAFVNHTHTAPSLILAADLNSHPYAFGNGHYSDTKHSDVYKLLTCVDHASECLHLVDNSADAKFYTYDTIHNHYAKNADFSNEPEGRIDYIFTMGDELKAKTSGLAFTENPISDHYGLMTTFDYQPSLRLPTAAQ